MISGVLAMFVVHDSLQNFLCKMKISVLQTLNSPYHACQVEEKLLISLQKKLVTHGFSQSLSTICLKSVTRFFTSWF